MWSSWVRILFQSQLSLVVMEVVCECGWRGILVGYRFWTPSSYSGESSGPLYAEGGEWGCDPWALPSTPLVPNPFLRFLPFLMLVIWAWCLFYLAQLSHWAVYHFPHVWVPLPHCSVWAGFVGWALLALQGGSPPAPFPDGTLAPQVGCWVLTGFQCGPYSILILTLWGSHEN